MHEALEADLQKLSLHSEQLANVPSVHLAQLVEQAVEQVVAPDATVNPLPELQPAPLAQVFSAVIAKLAPISTQFPSLKHSVPLGVIPYPVLQVSSSVALVQVAALARHDAQL